MDLFNVPQANISPGKYMLKANVTNKLRFENTLINETIFFLLLALPPELVSLFIGGLKQFFTGNETGL